LSAKKLKYGICSITDYFQLFFFKKNKIKKKRFKLNTNNITNTLEAGQVHEMVM